MVCIQKDYFNYFVKLYLRLKHLRYLKLKYYSEIAVSDG
jgi:hypothetical protein